MAMQCRRESLMLAITDREDRASSAQERGEPSVKCRAIPVADPIARHLERRTINPHRAAERRAGACESRLANQASRHGVERVRAAVRVRERDDGFPDPSFELLAAAADFLPLFIARAS